MGEMTSCVYTISNSGANAGCDLAGTATTTTADLLAADFTFTGGTKCTSAPTITLTLTNPATTADTGGLYATVAVNTIDGTFAGHPGLTTSNVVARTANTDIAHGHLYQLWDAGKIQGCKCDLGFDGPDCSHRISPHGDDPLTTVKSSMRSRSCRSAAPTTPPSTPTPATAR